MPTENESRPAGNGAASTTTPDSPHYIAGLRRRRAAAGRLPALACGRADPWYYEQPENPSGRYIDGYRDAAQHLLNAGLPPAPNVPAMRSMWRQGGEDRRLVGQVAELWVIGT